MKNLLTNVLKRDMMYLTNKKQGDDFMKYLKEKLEKEYKDFGWEVALHFQREHTFEECNKAINDYIDRLMEEGREYVYMFASCLVLDDKSVGGEPMDLWIRFYD